MSVLRWISVALAFLLLSQTAAKAEIACPATKRSELKVFSGEPADSERFQRSLQGEVTAKIFGGSPAFDEHSVVSVHTEWRPGQSGGCTGTLIGRNRILTASHCVCTDCPMTVEFGAGRRAFGPFGFLEPLTVKVRDRFRFGQSSGKAGEDIAVLVLDDHEICDAYTKPEPIVSTRRVLNGRLGDFEIVGFGYTERVGERTDVKRRAEVSALTLTCAPLWAWRAGCYPFREFALLGDKGIPGAPGLRPDTCRGDSGGPAFVKDGDGKRLGVAGVTSRGLLPIGGQAREGCGYGGIYTFAGSAPVLRFLRRHVPDLVVIGG